MTKKILVSYDFSQNEIQNAKIQNLAADPSTPVAGQVWYNTTTGKLVYRGAAVNIDPTARTNHTGTQLASTISDLSTSVQAIRLNQFAAPTGAVSMNGQNLTNVGYPTSNTDAANKGYVDASVNGTDWKQSARAATTANITLSGLQTIDGISVLAGQRVLVKDQADAKTNGIYVTGTGAWYRAYDADSANKVTPGMSLMVEEGTTSASTQWRVITTGDIQIGITAFTFAQIGAATSYTEGAGINIVGNVISANTGLLTRKFAATVGGATSNAVTHNFNTMDVAVQVFSQVTGELIECDITRTNGNTVTLGFAVAPAANSIRVMVLG